MRMLSFFILFSQMAFAQLTCTPPDQVKETNMAICGEDRVTTYASPSQKIQSITLLFKLAERGIERYVVIKNPNLTVTQVNASDYVLSPAVKKQMEQIKKEWKTDHLQYEVTMFEMGAKTVLYSEASLKTKVSPEKINRKINRAVASEGPDGVGGVRRAKESHSK